MVEVHLTPSKRDPNVMMVAIIGDTREEVEREVGNLKYDHVQLTTLVRSNAGRWARIGRAWSNK